MPDYYLQFAKLSSLCRLQFEKAAENAYNEIMRSKEATARRLFALRQALKLNGKEMGKICKIKPTMWSLYESGERALTLKAAYKIIDGTHGAVDLNYLYEGKMDGVRHSLAIQLQRGAA